MGYHVRITTKYRDFNFSDFNIIKENLIQKYGLIEQLDTAGNFNFLFSNEDEDLIIFFDDRIGFWVKNPDDKMINFLINLSRNFNDEYHVIGDEDEIYHSTDLVECKIDSEMPNFIKKIKEKLTDFFRNYLILMVISAILLTLRYFLSM